MSHMSIMTLEEAITAVPQLGSSCSLVLEQDGAPGSGIKIMRQVSKQLRTAMLGVMQGYTMNLDGSGVGLLSEMALLRASKLSRLRVVVTQGSDGGRPRSLSGWDTHSLHLSCFINGMGQAIKGISRLEVDGFSVGEGSADKVSALLSQLAPVCPVLQHLQLTGDVGRGLLVAFGESCSKLSCLEVMEGVSTDALRQLHLVMPALTHCKVKAPSLDFMFPPAASPFLLALCSCTSITSLDVGTAKLTDDLWQALPAGLKDLSCSFEYRPWKPLVILRTFNHLEQLRCYCNPGGNYTFVTSLTAVLRAAPKIKRLIVSGNRTDHVDTGLVSQVYLQCESANIPDLLFLNDRLCSGLAVTSTLTNGGGDFVGLNVGLCIEEFEEYSNFVKFFAGLPALSGFTGLLLSDDGDHPESSVHALTQAVAALFPSLKALELDLAYTINSRDLKHFASFTALQHLSFRDAQVSLAELALLCNHMPSLQMLRLNDCTDFTVADGEALQMLLRNEGSPAMVVVVLESTCR